MTCGRERGTGAESEKSKSPKRSRCIVRLVSPIPISNASAPDQVSPPDIIMNASKDDLCFGNSEKIKVVYEEDMWSLKLVLCHISPLLNTILGHLLPLKLFVTHQRYLILDLTPLVKSDGQTVMKTFK